MINIGAKVVHNPEGVCLINEMVKIQDDMYDKKEYYKLIPVQNQTVAVYIPVKTAGTHVRKLRSKKEIQSILESCQEINLHWDQNEQRRITKRQKAMQEDDGPTLAKLIKIYHNRKKVTHMPVKDCNWLKQAEQFLGSEVAEVLHIEFQEALMKIIG